MTDKFERAVDNVADAAKNARDSVAEAVHKSKADVEREKRAEFGETMTASEKLGSVGEEFSEEAKAGYDRAKRGVRAAD